MSYRAHAVELGNVVPTEPLLFLKPTTSYIKEGGAIVVRYVTDCAYSRLASFPGQRRYGLATSASSNCYFLCQKVVSTNQISECCRMTTVKPNCIMH